MSKNRGVVYVKPGVVEVRDIADPKFEDPHGRKINHAVILKIVSTNICGSDQHMAKGIAVKHLDECKARLFQSAPQHTARSDHSGSIDGLERRLFAAACR
jgi:hypothetical protein